MATDYLGENERCAVAILNVGGMDHGMNEIALGVGHDVPLATLDLLACIIAPWPAALGGLDALAVDGPRRSERLRTQRFPDRSAAERD